MARKEESEEEYYLYTDPYRTKDLIWDAYYGFVKHYNDYRMFRHLGRTKGPFMGGLVKDGVFMFEEIDCFLDKIYTKDEQKVIVKKIRDIFATPKLKFTDKQIMMLRTFFGKFMVDSGIKNIIFVKDNSSPMEKLMAERYPDIASSKEKIKDEEDS